MRRPDTHAKWFLFSTFIFHPKLIHNNLYLILIVEIAKMQNPASTVLFGRRRASFEIRNLTGNDFHYLRIKFNLIFFCEGGAKVKGIAEICLLYTLEKNTGSSKALSTFVYCVSSRTFISTSNFFTHRTNPRFLWWNFNPSKRFGRTYTIMVYYVSKNVAYIAVPQFLSIG